MTSTHASFEIDLKGPKTTWGGSRECDANAAKCSSDPVISWKRGQRVSFTLDFYTVVLVARLCTATVLISLCYSLSATRGAATKEHRNSVRSLWKMQRSHLIKSRRVAYPAALMYSCQYNSLITWRRCRRCRVRFPFPRWKRKSAWGRGTTWCCADPRIAAISGRRAAKPPCPVRRVSRYSATVCRSLKQTYADLAAILVQYRVRNWSTHSALNIHGGWRKRYRRTSRFVARRRVLRQHTVLPVYVCLRDVTLTKMRSTRINEPSRESLSANSRLSLYPRDSSCLAVYDFSAHRIRNTLLPCGIFVGRSRKSTLIDALTDIAKRKSWIRRALRRIAPRKGWILKPYRVAQ